MRTSERNLHHQLLRSWVVTSPKVVLSPRAEGAGHGADDLCGVIGLASEPFRGGSMQVPARRMRRRVGALTMRARRGASRQRMSAFGLGALVSNITELFRSLEKPSLAGLPFFVGR
jgi:hypothetical protein